MDVSCVRWCTRLSQGTCALLQASIEYNFTLARSRIAEWQYSLEAYLIQCYNGTGSLIPGFPDSLVDQLAPFTVVQRRFLVHSVHRPSPG